MVSCGACGPRMIKIMRGNVYIPVWKSGIPRRIVGVRGQPFEPSSPDKATSEVLTRCSAGSWSWPKLGPFLGSKQALLYQLPLRSLPESQS